MTVDPMLRDRLAIWAELDELLDRPEFDRNRTGINTTYTRLQAFGRALGPATEIHGDPHRMLAGMEWAGTVDPAVMHAAMVHYGVATTALLECGHPGAELERLLAELDAMRAPGTILVTELGCGGSQVNVRTEARYHRETGRFTLHTPDDAALKIMGNVGWPAVARTAVVNARLLDGDTDHGTHAFAFRFPHPRASTARLPGSGPVPLDYALIRFQQAEIPFDHWLSDNASLTEDGFRDPLSAQQRLARSLGGVNAAVVAAAVALSAATRATASTVARYCGQRRVGREGKPVLDFPTHSGELASMLARTYATGYYVGKVRRDFIAERNTGAGPAGTSVDAGHAPWLTAGHDRTLAKVAAADTLETVGATGRRLCGLHGVLHANRIIGYEGMAHSFHSAGGDTRLLLLEVGNQLVDRTEISTATVSTTVEREPFPALPYVRLRERTLAEQLCNRADPDADLPGIETLARVHLQRRILEELETAWETAERTWRDLLWTVRRVYGIDVLLESADWHLNNGTMRCGDLDSLHTEHTAACGQLLHRLDSLIDGLAVPPGRVDAFIGRGDYVQSLSALLH
ncbi:hypothetical protein [Sciscionella sediminilitoris]|uniref:acyl-CoA dehydrogenase family protein n=1 Tax=Sciscionella sediminilitoris TaxID=1445613 RepID=UPI0004DEE5DC|nr:hypothetical protein [Sciscionella sp. SE31]